MTTPLRIITPRDAAAQEIAEKLRALAARAEAGEFVSLVVAAERADGMTEHLTTPSDDYARTLGHLRLLSAMLERQWLNR